MFGVIGLTSFLLLPLMAAAGMALVGGSTVLAPSALILLPFMLARAG